MIMPAMPDEPPVPPYHLPSGHNPYLLRSLDGLRDAMALLGKTTLSDPTRWYTALEEHQAMLMQLKTVMPLRLKSSLAPMFKML